MKIKSTSKIFAVIIGTIVVGVVWAASSLPGTRFQGFLPGGLNPEDNITGWVANCSGTVLSSPNGNPDFSKTVQWKATFGPLGDGTLPYPVSSYTYTWHGNKVEGQHGQSININYPYEDTLQEMKAYVDVRSPSGEVKHADCIATLPQGKLQLQVLGMLPIGGKLNVSCKGTPVQDRVSGKKVTWSMQILAYSMNGVNLDPGTITEYYWYGLGLPDGASPATVTVNYPKDANYVVSVWGKAMADFGIGNHISFMSASCAVDLSQMPN